MTFNKLNEDNIQRSFLYNRVDNTYNYKTVEGEFVVGGENTALANGSDVYACDIGWTVEGDSNVWQFLVDGSLANKLAIKTVSSVEELTLLDFSDNICGIVVNDAYLSNIVFIPNRYVNKKITYKVTTLNSAFSSFMMNQIAFKLNNFDVDEYIALKQSFSQEVIDREAGDTNLSNLIDEKIESISNRFDGVDTSISDTNNEMASNKVEMEGKITDETTAREEAITEVNTRIDNLNNVAEELVNNEKADREASIKVISDKLDKEIQDRKDIDTDIETKITTETNARETKDTELENTIQNLSNRLDEETQNRLDKDNELENKICKFKTSANQSNFSNIEYIEYDNGYKELTAIYTETNTASIDSLGSYSAVIVLPVITDVKFIDIKADKDLMVYYTVNDNKIHYVNVSKTVTDINGTKLSIYIRGK